MDAARLFCLLNYPQWLYRFAYFSTARFFKCRQRQCSSSSSFSGFAHANCHLRYIRYVLTVTPDDMTDVHSRMAWHFHLFHYWITSYWSRKQCAQHRKEIELENERNCSIQAIRKRDCRPIFAKLLLLPLPVLRTKNLIVDMFDVVEWANLIWVSQHVRILWITRRWKSTNMRR